MYGRWWRGRRLLGWLLLAAVLVLNVAVYAQEGGLIAPPELPRLPEAPPEVSPESPLLPPPILPPVPPLAPEERELAPGPKLFVHKIIVTGSTVFSEAKIAELTRPFVGRGVTSEELESLRLALTRLYITAGYVNSGAVLPDQDVSDGVVRFEIIEGTLTDVAFSDLKWFRESYLRKRLTLGVKKPLNIKILQERLQFLQQDDRIARLEAELQPGIRLGESALYLRVKENLPFNVILDFNNYQSPTVGAERGQLTVLHRNLTGSGDVLQITAGVSAGVGPQIDTSYTLPVSPRDLTIRARYRLNVSSVIEEPFDALDFRSRSEIFTLALRRPFYRTLNRELALGLSMERLRSRTTLLGIPFNTPGTEDGASTVTALRFTAEWVGRTTTRVLALRSRFSLGVDLFGATINTGDVPSGKFFAWLGQFQVGQRMGPQGVELLFRLDIQLTTDPLFPLEQLAIGGRYSVRGYRENQLVRDNGLLTSLESRIPLLQNRPWAEYLQLVPFIDFGWGENQRVPTPSITTLSSIGIGLRWAARWQRQETISARLGFEIFWGYRLTDIETQGDDLQDKGLHFQVFFNAF